MAETDEPPSEDPERSERSVTRAQPADTSPRDGDADRTDHDQRVRQFVERFALVMTEAGLPRMPARVLACVLVEDTGRLTARELSERLQVSPAAISGAVRYLVDMGVLRRERLPGQRVDHYCFGDDQWFEMYTERDAVVGKWEKAAAEGAGLLGDTPAGRRLAETEEFFRFMRNMLTEIGKRWPEHRARRFSDR